MSTTTFSCHQQQQEYRGVLALNNLGVSLLERGCYQYGMMTLKDAVEGMRAVVGNCSRRQGDEAGKYQNKSQDGGEGADSAIDLNRKVQRAYERFSKTISTTTTPSNRIRTRPRFVKSVVYEQDDLFSFFSTLRDDSISVNCFRPSKIETFDCSEERDVGLDFMLLLCNFGISCHLLAGANPNHTATLHRIARGAFGLAAANVANRFSRCGGLDFEGEATRALVVAMLVTGNVCQVHTENGSADEAVDLYGKYHAIRDALDHRAGAMWSAKTATCSIDFMRAGFVPGAAPAA